MRNALFGACLREPGVVWLAPVEDLRGAQLLEAIFAAPRDDTPRRIFADWLLELPDPPSRAWGRFITAQLDGDLPTTFQMLPHARARAALGWPLDDVRDSAFTRGFLTRVRLEAVEPAAVDETARRLTWGVLRYFNCPRQPDGPRTEVLFQVAARDRLRALEDFEGDSDTLDAIARGGPQLQLAKVKATGSFEGAGLSLATPATELALTHTAGFSVTRGAGRPWLEVVLHWQARVEPLVLAGFLSRLPVVERTVVATTRADPDLRAALTAAGFTLSPG